MKSNILGAVRALLLLYLVGMMVTLCIAEQKLPSPPPPSPKASEPSEQWTSLGTFRLTAYCPCKDCCGEWATGRPLDRNGIPIVYTASGTTAKEGTTIAVDPRIIPHGTKVKINNHIYVAEDTGGAIQGNSIDIYYDCHQDAAQFGVQKAEVFVNREMPKHD